MNEYSFIFVQVNPARGDGINPIIFSLYKRRNEIKLITVRHEEAAAMMASGYSKFTGKMAACIATTGPGMIHLINGLYDASTDNASVIPITGMAKFAEPDKQSVAIVGDGGFTMLMGEVATAVKYNLDIKIIIF